MITEVEIDEKLESLRGKVPNFLIEDLRERLVSKQDILTREHVDKIIERVLKIYSGQLEKISRLDQRVEEIGRYLEEIRNQLLAQRSPPREETATAGAPDIVPRISPSQEAKESLDNVPGESPEESSLLAPQENLEPLPQTGGFQEGGVMEQRMENPENRNIENVGSFRIPQDIEAVLFSDQPRRSRLERIPSDTVSTLLAMKWLGFLIDRAGIKNLERVLDFYYQIGWISEEVLYTLLRYAEGIRPHDREPDWRPDEKLTIQDHIISLLFIERLRGVRITREIVDAIERETRAIMRLLEDGYGV
ncbi:MAG: archaeal flagellar protein FlaD [Thermococcaceae archaeon]|nr:archaeal flagellar protein FlaD [Thermococcaceae archaeon]